MTKFQLGPIDNLPDGWATIQAGFFRQKRSKTFNPANAQEEAYELYSVPSHATEKPEIVTPSEIGSNKQLVETNDVLISKINPRLNRTWVVGDKGEFTQIASTEWVVFPQSDAMGARFLSRLLADYRVRDFLAANGSGVGGSLTRIRPDLFDNVTIPLPPINEQHRIVEKIEVLFDEIDRGVESLKTAKTTLGLYRQSLLKSAFEGRLTADWRAQNTDKLEDPETILDGIKKKREARYKTVLEDWKEALATWQAKGEKGKKPTKPKRPRDIPAQPKEVGAPGWTILPLGLVIEDPAYGTSKKSDYEGGEKGVLRIPNIGSLYIDPTDLKSADFDEAELRQYQLIEGDVLTIRSNGSLSLVGKPALVRAQDTNFVYAGYLIRLRPIPGSLVPKYLVYSLMEPGVRGQIEVAAKSTSGVNNINAKELQALEIPICSTAEQAEIVRILDKKLEAADALEAEIENGLTRADALRQSILKKAFSGQLVSQDPNDEPASVLLERIRAEKAEMARAAKQKKKSTPRRKPKVRIPSMTDLIEVLKKQKGWVAASKAAEGLGITNETSSDDVETFYLQLKTQVDGGKIDVERRGDEDWLKLRKAEVS